MKSLRTTTILLGALLLPGGFLLLVPAALRAAQRFRAGTLKFPSVLQRCKSR